MNRPRKKRLGDRFFCDAAIPNGLEATFGQGVDGEHDEDDSPPLQNYIGIIAPRPVDRRKFTLWVVDMNDHLVTGGTIAEDPGMSDEGIDIEKLFVGEFGVPDPWTLVVDPEDIDVVSAQIDETNQGILDGRRRL